MTHPTLTPVSFRKPKEHEQRLSEPYVPGRHSKRFWTDAEKKVLLDFYECKGPVYCARLLPERGVERVYQMAAKLGLRAPASAGQERQSLTSEERAELDRAITEAWPFLKGRGAVKALAERLGVKKHQVTKRATVLGLTMPHRKEPNWSGAELELLRRVSLHDPVSASRAFKDHGYSRSPTSIVVMAKRQGLSRRYKATYSAHAAAKILGIDGKTMTTWILEGLIKASRRETQRLPQQGGDPHSITRENLRAFIIENLERIDIRKVEKFSFVDLLVNHGAAAHEPTAAMISTVPFEHPTSQRPATHDGPTAQEDRSMPGDALSTDRAQQILECADHVVVHLGKGKYLVDGARTLSEDEILDYAVALESGER